MLCGVRIRIYGSGSIRNDNPFLPGVMQEVTIPRIQQLQDEIDTNIMHISWLIAVRETLPKTYKPGYIYDRDNNRGLLSGKIQRLRLEIRKKERTINLLK
jgi:hypothetical protein